MAPRLVFTTTTLSTRDPDRLAQFYERLLGCSRTTDSPGWVSIRTHEGHGIAFHVDDEYVAPTWPSRAEAQQMMAHIEIATDDLEAAVAFAEECGARQAVVQPQDDVRVMLDPDGHPFCLFHLPDMPTSP
jgi:catechol 2,3-dioxygenase-like lactoylglutathione lyase family enzyme